MVKYYIGIAVAAVVVLLTLPYAWQLIQILFMSPNATPLNQLVLYKWAAVGFGIFVFARRLLQKNLVWFETFSHELTHITVALMFFRKVHSFRAEEGSGVVYTSGTKSSMIVPMALAPYCLPIYTYILLALRSLIVPDAMWIFDILIGVSIAFHRFCFYHQTGNHQTDINQYPLTFSYMYIYAARLLNACIIAVSFFPNYNVFTSLWRCLTALCSNAIGVVA